MQALFKYIDCYPVTRRLPFELGSFLAGPWVAGGAARRLYAGEKFNCDIDVFFRSAIQHEQIAACLIENGAELIARSGHSNTWKWYCPKYSRDVIIQTICASYYPSPLHVAESFDYTISKFYISSEGLFGSEQAIRDVRKKRLFLTELGCSETRRDALARSTLKRIVKYHRQGYEFVSDSGQLAMLVARAFSIPEKVESDGGDMDAVQSYEDD